MRNIIRGMIQLLLISQATSIVIKMAMYAGVNFVNVIFASKFVATDKIIAGIIKTTPTIKETRTAIRFLLVT